MVVQATESMRQTKYSSVIEAMVLRAIRPGSACYWVLQLSVRVSVHAAGVETREAEESASQCSTVDLSVRVSVHAAGVEARKAEKSAS